jgi:SsrA-binding protein
MPNLATNKKAFADYEILEKLEAGLVLTGPEVKAAKASQINLKGSYVSIGIDDSINLIGAHISPYAPARGAQTGYDPTHSRKLLLKKQEIDRLRGKQREAGLTILPLSVYTKGSLVKLEIGIARGKRKYDKRASIRKRETDRDIRRLLRGK